MHTLPITTSSLRLRHFAPEDAAMIMQLNGEPSTSRWLPSHVYASMDEAASALSILTSCYRAPGDPRLGPYVLAIEHASTRALLGHVGFSPLERDVEVSFAIAEASRGHGYGAESLVHACRWAAAAFRLDRVVAVTAAANAASRRTLERAHFTHEQDAVMRFQGSQASVSHYAWRPRHREPGC